MWPYPEGVEVIICDAIPPEVGARQLAPLLWELRPEVDAALKLLAVEALAGQLEALGQAMHSFGRTLQAVGAQCAAAPAGEPTPPAAPEPQTIPAGPSWPGW